MDMHDINQALERNKEKRIDALFDKVFPKWDGSIESCEKWCKDKIDEVD